jgi:hypothetical protein
VKGSELYVADHKNSLVRKYNLQGTPVPGWTAPSVPAAFQLSLDSNSNLYVVGTSDGLLHKFNSSATPVATWDIGFGPNVRSITCDESDNVWLSGNVPFTTPTPGTTPTPIIRIKEYSNIGGTLNGWSTQNSYISSILVKNSTVYAGTYNGWVEMFTTSGSTLPLWQSGVSNLAMAFSPTGNLYVTGDSPGPVKYFTASTAPNLIGEWGSTFESWGMCVDDAGNIYVGNHFDGTISKFQP